MTTIDNKIVQMTFDNRQFERGVGETLKSLFNLKKGLDLEDSAKNLKNLDAAGKQVDLSAIAQGVENLNQKFSTLGIVGIVALQNITNSAINAGKRIMSALTIDPIKTGFQEYETQINATQTILANTASKGTTLKDVTAALNELNHYADLTIYNFTEMTRNIGTFTAAGVDLDVSVSAIKGIANLAAVSGSTSQQASTAMYQLSQALASGTVKLQDWNSVVNAGMGGAVFQDALKETARVHKINIDEMIRNEGSFRETLKDGWLTSEILTETLSKFTGDLTKEQLVSMGYTKDQADEIVKLGKMANEAATKVKTLTQLWDTLQEAAQSGWTQSWEIIFGDFEEVKETLTGVSDVISDMINKSSDARNELLSSWKELGGRTDLIDSIANAFKGVMHVVDIFKTSLREIFPPLTSEKLVLMTKSLKDLSEKFKMGDETSQKLKSTFKGMFSVIDIGRMIVETFAKALLKVVSAVLPLSGSILDITAYIGEWLLSIRNSVKESGIFAASLNLLEKIIEPLSIAFDKLRTATSKIFSKKDKSNVENYGKAGVESLRPIEVILSGITKTMNLMASSVSKVLPIVYQIGKAITKVFSKVAEVARGLFTHDNIGGFLDNLNKLLGTGILVSIFKWAKNLSNPFKDLKDTLGGVTTILDAVRSSLEVWQNNIQSKTILRIASALGILAIALTILATIDSGKMTSSLIGMGVLIAELSFGLKMISTSMTSKDITNMNRLTFVLVTFSLSLNILSSALVKLAKLNMDEILRGLLGIAGLGKILSIVSGDFSKSSKNMKKAGSGLISLALAINILVKAVKELGAINTESLIKGLAGVFGIATTLSLFLTNTDFNGLGIFKGAGLLLLATSIKMLSGVVTSFSEFSKETVIKGVFVIGALLLELAAFSRLASGTKGLISASIGMVILTKAISELIPSLKELSSMELGEIGRSLLALGGALLILGVSLNAMPPGMVAKGLGMLAIANALSILAKAMMSTSGMSWAEIAKSLILLAGSLSVITIALIGMTGAVSGALSLLVVANAIKTLVPSLVELGNLPLGVIVKSLIMLAGSFGIIGAAGLFIGPLVPAILGLSASIVALGISLFAIGAGVSLFAAGIATMSAAGLAGSVSLTFVITSIIGLIPTALVAIGEGLIALVKVLRKGLKEIFLLITDIVVGICDIIIKATPKVVSAMSTFILELIKVIYANAPWLIKAGLDMILNILKGIDDRMPEITNRGVNIILKFMDGVASRIDDIIQSGINLMLSFINGMAKGIDDNHEKVNDAVKNLITSIVGGAVSFILSTGSGVLDVGKEFVSGVAKGITTFAGDAVNAAKNLGSSILNGAKKALDINSPSRKAEKEVAKPFIDGAVKGLKKTAGLEKESEKLGGKFTSNTAKGIKKGSGKVKKAAKKQVKSLFDITKEGIDQRKKFNDISLEEEYSKWKSIQDKYKKGSKERLEIDKRMSDARQAIAKADFDHSVNWIENEKYYKRLSLMEELEAWERVQARFDKGTEERKKADREIFRLKQDITQKKEAIDLEYYNKTKEINDKLIEDINRVNEAYNNAVEDRANALANAYSLFEKVERSEDPILGRDLISNLESQVENFYQWQRDIQELSGRNISSGLYEELEKMGPKMAEQIRAINSLSDSELAKYSDLWETRYEEAYNRAFVELEGMRKNTDMEIKKLQSMADQELEKYKQVWIDKTTELATGVKANTNVMRTEVNKETTKLKETSIKDVSEMVSTMQKTMKDQPWYQTGVSMVDGITSGVKAAGETLISEMRSLAAASLEATRSELDIHSPSRKFEAIGTQSIAGWAKGIKKDDSIFIRLRQKFEGMYDIVEDGKSYLETALSGIQEFFDGDLDSGPVIKPILDLSDIEDKRHILDNIGKVDGALKVVVNNAKSISQKESSDKEDKDKGTNLSFVQNNYSPKSLSRAEVYRQTKNQISTMKEVLDTV